MKNKRMVSMCAALGLVAVVGVGGTLAYYSDTSSHLENKFVTSETGVKISLWEHSVYEIGNTGNYEIDTRAEKKVAGTENNGNEYGHVLPGATLYKDPTVTVDENSEDCYLFVSVKNSNSDLTIQDLDDWIEVTDVAGGANNTKYYVYDANGDKEFSEYDAVKGGTDAVVFTTVKYADVPENRVGEGNSIGNIVIKASAVQSANCAVEDAKNAGIELLKNLDN